MVQTRPLPSVQLFSQVSFLQGFYYLLTGLWPLISFRTFEKVTGPKTDHWLTKTVGILVSVVGGVLALAGWSGQTAREIPILAIGSAAGLASVDVVYALKRRISPIYLLDAVAEVALIGLWLFVRRRGKSVTLIEEVLRPAQAAETETRPR